MEREIIFNPSTAEEIVAIYIRNDQVLESSESFLAALSIPNGQQNVQLGVSTTQITISDNDGKCLKISCAIRKLCFMFTSLPYAVVTVQFEQVSCIVFEDSGVAEIKLTKTGLHAETISVLFSTLNGNTAGMFDISCNSYFYTCY